MWREYTTPTGRKYYHHQATNAVQWKPPPGWGGMTRSFGASASAVRSTRRSAVKPQAKERIDLQGSGGGMEAKFAAGRSTRRSPVTSRAEERVGLQEDGGGMEAKTEEETRTATERQKARTREISVPRAQRWPGDLPQGCSWSLASFAHAYSGKHGCRYLSPQELFCAQKRETSGVCAPFCEAKVAKPEVTTGWLCSREAMLVRQALLRVILCYHAQHTRSRP